MIANAILRAYKVMNERNWNRVYWAIDLHGVCLKSNYSPGGYEWENDAVVPALQAICKRPESRIILWSSAHEEEQPYIIQFFKEHGIEVFAFNANPEVKNTKTGDFEKKFYFSVLLDDKAGFEPEYDWSSVQFALRHIERTYPSVAC